MWHNKPEEFLALIRSRLEKPRQIRIILIFAVFLLLFCVLISKLYDLQVVNGDNYSASYLEKIERTVKTAGARGNIYDVNGNLLAYNKLCYNVTIADNGAYTGDYNARNLMLYRLATLLEKHEIELTTSFYVKLDESGTYSFTAKSDTSRRRFIANVYGISSSLLDSEEKYSSDVTAEDLLNKKISDYKFNEMKDSGGNPVIPSDRTMLDMVKILFTMRQSAFQRYETTTIAEDIDENTMAEILENQGSLQGVSVEETYARKYNNAKYFSHIIGYTGAIQNDEQLQELKKSNADYDITDIVGATGIEKSMELELQGIKGEKKIYVDSYGQILEVISETSPQAGNDLYLSIDQNLQIGIYHLLEQQLAAILGNKIVNMKDADIVQSSKSSEIVISVDDAYFQLINNNILDCSHFASEDAGPSEKIIAQAFLVQKNMVLNQITYELLTDNDVPMEQLSKEYITYMAFIYDHLCDTGIIEESKIDTYGDSYLSWKNDTISLRDYLFKGIGEGWINTTSLEQQKEVKKYQDSEYIYNLVLDHIIAYINSSEDFDKLVYKYMIINNKLKGRDLLRALYEQGVLAMDVQFYRELETCDAEYSYQFLIDRIFDIDITPAQLALDPCMGSVVVTDTNTGAVRALVTYPGYDNNRITDRDYFNQCMNDLSLPLINSATQTNKAPGSTFKPLSAIAALEEGAVDLYEEVNCTGIYTDVVPNIKCWIGLPGHGNLNVEQAIENSCNFCFATYAHRLSTYKDPETGEFVYSTQLGIEKLETYAKMFGFDRVSGIEIDEKEPSISDQDPERTAFGQGTHSFNNVQLARYTVALANGGKVFDLTLLSKETDTYGNLKEEFQAEQTGEVNIADSTWNAVHNGLRAVVTTGAARSVFTGWETVKIAGKTGTAEEVKTRGNHAYFISYAPYSNPEIAVNVAIPFGYSSGNAAKLARNVYDFYYGATELTTIVDQDARSISLVNIVDE